MNRKLYLIAGKPVTLHLTMFLLLFSVVGTCGLFAGEKVAGNATFGLTRVETLAGLKPTIAYDSLLAPAAALKVRWALPINGTTIRRIIMPSEESRVKYILVETQQNDLIALRRDNGQALWWIKLNAEITGDVFVGNYSVLLVSNGRVIRLEKMSGDILWNVDLPFAPSAGPTAIDENEKSVLVFVPGLDRVIYAFDVESVVWPPKNGEDDLTRRDFQVNLNRLRLLWRYSAEGLITNSLLYSADKLFSGCWTNKAYGISIVGAASRGSPSDVWRFRSHRGFRATPVADGPYILFPCLDNTLYCLSSSGGGLTWRYIASDSLYTSPQLLKDKDTEELLILQKVGKAGDLICLDRIGGRPRWSHKGGKQVVGMLTVDNSDPKLRRVAITADEDGSLSGILPFAADTRDSKQKKLDVELQAFAPSKVAWRVEAKGITGFVANTYDSMVFGMTKDKSAVVAIEER